MDPLNSTSNFVNFDKFHFTFTDNVLFGLLLLVSLAIGIYFGYFGKTAETTDEYLLGERRMKPLPIAVSLISSQVSPLSIMALPADLYFYGIHYVYVVVNIVSLVLLWWHLIIPIFYANNISNCYEYLELRFDKKTRQIITISFLITIYLIIPVLIFIPALAYSQVTGTNIHIVNGLVCSVCVFYTMLGGIKAVVWTDVVQAAIMMASVVIVSVLGVIRIGGVQETLQRSAEGGRLHTDFAFDMTTRATFWNCAIGGVFVWTGYVGLNQSSVQRLVALPSLDKAKRSLLIFAVGFLILMGINCFTGLIIFARYHKCDPFRAGLLDKPDKLVPFFIQDIVGHVTGMPGIFISCVFSAALSTISANFNSLTGIIYFDYIRPFVNHTQRKATVIMRLLVLLTGVYCIVAGFVVEEFTSVLQMVITISGITHGPLIGAFTMGMLFPRAHGKAVFISIVSSMAAMFYIITVAQYKIKDGDLKYVLLPSSIEECALYNISTKQTENSSNQTSINMADYRSTIVKDPEIFSITNLSFNWYAVTGTLLVWLLGVPLSYFLSPGDVKKLDPKLLSPWVRSFIPNDVKMLDEIPLRVKGDEYVK